MVRVAGLKDQVREGIVEKSPDGLTPAEQLARIGEAVGGLASDQQARWRALREDLRKENIVLVDGADVTKAEKAWLEDHFLASHLSGADPARDRSGASVPVHSQSRLHHRAAARARERRARHERADPRARHDRPLHPPARSGERRAALHHAGARDRPVHRAAVSRLRGEGAGRLPRHPRQRRRDRGRGRGSGAAVRVGAEAPPPRLGDPPRSRCRDAGGAARFRAARAQRRRRRSVPGRRRARARTSCRSLSRSTAPT